MINPCGGYADKEGMAKKNKQLAVSKFAQLVKAGVEERCLLSRMELEVEESKRRLGQKEMDKRLAELPPENGRPKACPRCGRNARVRAKDLERTFSAMSGTHTIRRNYHYCDACKAGFFPRDEFLGLPRQGEVSVEVDKRLADFLMNDPFETAERRWNFHYRHLKVSSNQFRNVAKRLGAKAEEANPELLQAALCPPSPEASDTIYFMSDGGMVPMRPDWAEVKLGIVFRHESHLREDETTRGVISQARYVAQLGEQDAFVEQVSAALNVEKAAGARQVVYIADGAPENWNLATKACPGATQILDWYHAVENVMKCGKALLGEQNEAALACWEVGAKVLLAQGQIEPLVKTLMEVIGPQTTEDELSALENLVRYVRNNQSRMKYDEFREKNLLIGSGPIESAQHHVIQIRMKRTGQHWSNRGARQMARMRAAYRTAGPEHFYDAIHWAYRETVRQRSTLENIALCRKPPKRRASNV